MKKRNLLMVAVLALAFSLALIGPAAAQDAGAGFYVDCTGAYGFGWVPAHESVWWDITVWDPNAGWLYFDGAVLGGETGAPFNPEVLWPVEITPGTSYFWVYIKGDLVQEGHFDCEPPPPPGGACTPGYWRNLKQHGDEWELTPYSPADDFDTVFSVDLFYPDITLGEAIVAGGGGVDKLARHGTAALLNAAHPDVGYPLSVEQVIAAVQAGAADMLANINDVWDCPLN